MATNRLTFLYPHLCRTGRWSEPAAAQAVAARKSRQRRRQVEATPAATSFSTSAHLPTTPISRCQHAAPFTTHAIARQAAFPKRHGKAVEPLPLPALESTQQASSSEQNKIGEQAAAAGSPPAPPPQQLQQPPPTPDVSASDSAAAATTAEPDPRPSPPPRPPPKAAEDQNEDLGKKAKGTSGPMDTILHMEPPPSPVSPVSYASDSTKDPPNHMVDTHMLGPHLHHLHPPPYVHHFDSYSLVKQLSAGGYTLNQSITAMKAVRGLLASNLDVAQSQLVSKSDVENETYLFRAACSELSAEVHNNRRVADEALRQQRTHLQHEVDILTQHLNQELLTLTDSVRGMFNDRRMAVREEQKTVESRIQQINYKISVMLNSDMKSEIEALRWVLIRRSVLGIVCLVFLAFGTLRYASYVSHERQREAERLKREREQEIEEGRKQNGKLDNTPATDAAEILAAA